MEKKDVFTIELTEEELKILRSAVFSAISRDKDFVENLTSPYLREMYANELKVLQLLNDRLL